MTMTNNKVNVLFNTDKYYIDQFLPDIEKVIPEVIFSSENLLVYLKNDLEVMINNLGTVSITPNINNLQEFRSVIPNIIKEYDNLTLINNKFDHVDKFKVIAPKSVSGDIISQLNALNYNTKLVNTNNMHTVSVET